MGRPRSPVARFAKRAVDVAGSAAGLLATAPLLVAVAALIRLDTRGSILFVQDRVGRDGKLFRMVKFRTMLPASVQFNPDGSTRVGDRDPRVTRVGRLLRGGLDELPQLWNVLRGDMSLVGPRPDMEIHAAQYSAAERRKLEVRPGMTSLAAVVGRNQLPWKRRIAIDLAYIDGWSLTLDAKIIVQTLCLPARLRPFAFGELLAAVDGDA